MPERPHVRALRGEDGAGEVTNIELFFDLVYVFAVTQLSQLLVHHPDAGGVAHAAVLLAMVWQIWVYTTWAVNYLDPNRTPVRIILLLLMLGSLVLAAAIPDAFHGHGLLVAVTYVAMQAGRVGFTIWTLRGERLQLVFVRILPWTLTSSVVVLLGAAAGDGLRTVAWAAAIAIDLVGASLGFFVPGLGRSATTDWTINGSHFAERCQAFVLIALGESIIVIGSRLELDDPSSRNVLAFGAAFAGAVALWWIYFDRAAADSAREIEGSTDPGRLARNAFHYVHPLIIGGIILTAAADERVLDRLDRPADTGTTWLLLGGVGLFLAGHALFKALVWRAVSWPRLGAVVVLGAGGAVAPHVSGLALAIGTLAVLVAVAVADRYLHPVEAAPARSSA
ncbi:MAG TPA: low temperature requirement protein A [Jatrophihabitans sp.]|nr:low temperature requirement protein A [Jatrophihabitans sp.]